jgi:hypothetical protein
MTSITRCCPVLTAIALTLFQKPSQTMPTLNLVVNIKVTPPFEIQIYHSSERSAAGRRHQIISARAVQSEQSKTFF